jgi:hypothetical protein
VSLSKPWTRGLVRVHSDNMSLPWTYGLVLHTHFAAQMCFRLTHSHTHSHSTVLLPHSLNLREMVSSQNVVTRSNLISRSWSDSTSASWGRPEFKPWLLPVWWAALSSLVPVSHQVLLCSEDITPTHHEDKSHLWNKLSVGPMWGQLLLVVREMCPCNKEGEKTTTFLIPMSRQEMLRET